MEAPRKALDDPASYGIAWIAALPIERAAAEAMLDEEHHPPKGFVRHQSDSNVYTWGRMGEHDIVIASLTAGVYGTTSAATTALRLLASIPSIRIGFLVGIGGGIARPDKDRDIRLGDVVVSQPDGTTGGVCQYDLVKAKSGDIRERKGFLAAPPTVLLNALASIQAYHERRDSRMPHFLKEMMEKHPKMRRNYGYQGEKFDRLFEAHQTHVPGSTCKGCDPAGEVERDARDTTDPEIHYGIIASGNTLVKDAAARDRIVEDIGEDCLCFEMEAAGLMNHFPCLVVRGICDYADSHKNDRLQRHASATAAAYAKELLTFVPVADVQNTQMASQITEIRETLDSVAEATGAISVAVDHIRADRHMDNIRKWLRPPDPSTNLNNARKHRQQGTGSWLLESETFQSWVSGPRRFLWLHALAGCGKSVLSSTILDYLAQKEHGLVIKFFFDFSDASKQKRDGMMRSLAFQLYNSEGASARKHLDMMYHAHHDGQSTPGTDSLSETVFKMLACSERIYIVLDALDESTTRNELTAWIRQIYSTPDLDHIHLLCTSRPEAEFLRHIPRVIGEENCLSLEKRAINADIRSYVEAQLSMRQEFRDKGLSQDVINHIQTRVGDGADGMFRWAFCQLDSLARCHHEAAIEEALADMPQDLDETYLRMLSNIPVGIKQDAIRLLQFLVHCNRAIELEEAVDIIATNIDAVSPGFDVKRRLFNKMDVLTYCQGLVKIVRNRWPRKFHELNIQLSHFSVKEYLLKHPDMDIVLASTAIIKTCLAYLEAHADRDEFDGDPPHLRNIAAKSWEEFAPHAEKSSEGFEAILKFLKTESVLQRWGSFETARCGFIKRGGTPLYYACLWGIVRTAELLLDCGHDANEVVITGKAALCAASQEGHHDIAALLLAKGADVNGRVEGYPGPLWLAAKSGHMKIVQLLLGVGSTAVTRPSASDHHSLTAASEGGHLDITNLLLSKGADVNAKSEIYGSALEAAAYHGHLDITNLLLSKGADVNAKSERYSSALEAAAYHGHLDITNLLLSKGADVNAKSERYGSALEAAASRGHLDITSLLVSQGADVNMLAGQHSQSALHTAITSLRGPKVVKLLLDAGANVNLASFRHGNTPLLAAILYAKEDLQIIEMLLDVPGIDVARENYRGFSPLSLAAARGRIDIMQLLLDTDGVDVNGKLGSNKQPPLGSAAESGKVEAVRMLLNANGIEINAADSDERTPLHLASREGHATVVEMLLDQEGIDLGAEDIDGLTALQLAVFQGHTEIESLLDAVHAPPPDDFYGFGLLFGDETVWKDIEQDI